MKRIFLTAVSLLLCAFAAYSAPKRYSISLLGEYGYNYTWQHFGGAELQAFMPVNDHVEIEAAAAALSSNNYSVGATIRPKIALPVGELFFDASMLYTAANADRIHDAIGAISIGYRMDYVSFQIGSFYRTMADYDRAWHSTDSYVCEPFNVLYRLAFNVRPISSRWNIHFGMTDFTETEYERMWQPIFFIGGYYDFKPKSNFEYEYNAASHFRLLAEVICKPTGMFHLDASFYGIVAKVGCAYKF